MAEIQSTFTFSCEELNEITRQFFTDEKGPYPRPKKWKRMFVGPVETYVGDDIFVVALVETLPKSMEDIETNGSAAEQMIIRYLQGEGFIGNDYAYVGFQRFDINHPPEGLELD